MDTTRRYRDIQSLRKLHEDYGNPYGGGSLKNLPPPKLTKNFKEFKYYDTKGDGFDWVRETQKGRRHFNVLDGSETGGLIDIYNTIHSKGIKKDESGRPYVVIKYDPSRTGSRMPIEKKGDKWFLEDELGFASRDRLGQRKREVVVNDRKGLEVRKVM